MKIAIIGGGNLGLAIAEGLLNSAFCQPQDLTITRRQVQALDALAQKGCQVHSNNALAVQQSELILLAVKPYNYAAIVAEIAPFLQPNAHVLCSVITGVWIKQLQQAIGKPVPIVRAMPNTAIAIRQSMTCLAMDGLSDVQAAFIQQLFDQLGRTAIIDEGLMDAATVLGACGTAFAMRYIRANIQGGIEIGFDAQTASLIAAQTVLGAADLLLKTGSHPEKEIDKVTTPKGCTIAGLNEMEHQGFSSSLIRGLVTSFEKIGK
jgi:pyrroline-5-carboxylate reductase